LFIGPFTFFPIPSQDLPFVKLFYFQPLSGGWDFFFLVLSNPSNLLIFNQQETCRRVWKIYLIFKTSPWTFMA